MFTGAHPCTKIKVDIGRRQRWMLAISFSRWPFYWLRQSFLLNSALAHLASLSMELYLKILYLLPKGWDYKWVTTGTQCLCGCWKLTHWASREKWPPQALRHRSRALLKIKWPMSYLFSGSAGLFCRHWSRTALLHWNLLSSCLGNCF